MECSTMTDTGGTATVSIFSGSLVIAEYDNGADPSAPSQEYIYSGKDEKGPAPMSRAPQ
jgi:hypothetical protein